MSNFKKVFQKCIVTLLTLSIILSTSVPIFAASSDYRLALVKSITGDVKVSRSGGEKTFNAFKGMSLKQGDSLTTGKNSTVELSIDDDKELKIGENSKVSMSELAGSVTAANEQTGIKLWYGKVWSNIKKKLNVKSKYEVETPTTVAGARGTQFFVGQDSGHTDVAVLEGTVVATAYIPVSQPSGESTDQQETREIDTVINANQQVTIDPETLMQQPEPEIQVEQVTQQSLDLFVLETIMEEPQGIDQSLLNNINQVVDERRQQQAEQEAQQKLEPTPAPTATPFPVYDEAVVATPTPAPTPYVTPAPVQTNTPFTYISPSTSPSPTPSDTATPTPTPPASAVLTVTIVNNGGLYNDYVDVVGGTPNAKVNLYADQYESVPSYNYFTLDGSGNGRSSLLNLNSSGGNLYISYTINNVEGNREVNSYAPETSEASILNVADLSIACNNDGINSISLNNLSEGDILKVYNNDDSTNHTPLNYAIVPPGNTGLYGLGVSLTYCDTYYVSVVSKGKVESPRVPIHPIARLMSNSSIAAGGTPGTVKINASPDAGDSLRIITSSTYFDKPKAGDEVSNITLPYTSGSDISDVDPTLYKYLGLYEVKVISPNDIEVVAFQEFTLSFSDITYMAPQFSGLTVGQGILPAAVKINYSLDGTHHLKYIISQNNIETPINGTSESSIAALPTYSPGADIGPVSPGWHVGLYEVYNYTSNIDKFSDIVVVGTEICGYDSTATIPAPTIISAVDDDISNPGVTGEDFHVTWTISDPQNKVYCQMIYILPAGETFDVGKLKPVDIINGNSTENWTGTNDIISDSRLPSVTHPSTFSLRAGTYDVYVVEYSLYGIGYDKTTITVTSDVT